MPRDTGVETGRKLQRTPRRCEGCEARLTIGDPKPNGAWAQRLKLTPEQVDLLLIAAAEYRDLCDEAGEYQEAVAFVDWVSVDALRYSIGSPVVAAYDPRRKAS
jgi:hypothetical protein